MTIIKVIAYRKDSIQSDGIFEYFSTTDVEEAQAYCTNKKTDSEANWRLLTYLIDDNNKQSMTFS